MWHSLQLQEELNTTTSSSFYYGLLEHRHSLGPTGISSGPQEAVAMSAEASVGLPALLASEGCRSLIPTQNHRAGVTFDLKPLSPSSKYVKLNVGGSLHYTTVQTLTKHDTILKAMFSGRMEVLTDSEGWILIDRSGKHFGTILNYLRDDSVSLPESQRELEEVLCEARYYVIQGLVESCQQAMQQKIEGFDPMCLIPMVTSPKEEQKIISSCAKPVVKLLHNRSNNKFSYTR